MALVTVKSLGANSRVRVNGTLYGVRSGTLVYMLVETHDVTNTESPKGPQDQPRVQRDPGRQEAEITLTGHLDPTVSPFAAPLTLFPGDRPDIVVYENGLTGKADLLNDVLIDRFEKNPVGDPTQPNGFTLHGFTGDFTPADT